MPSQVKDPTFTEGAPPIAPTKHLKLFQMFSLFFLKYKDLGFILLAEVFVFFSL